MADPKAEQPERKPSWGNISEDHWSVARRDDNVEALEYYRERSKAPGVAEGGGSRNFYCMSCDGVIPHEPPVTHCPHCGVLLDEKIKRYFNWVEMNEPAESDLRALLPVLVPAALIALAGVAGLLWWWLG